MNWNIDYKARAAKAVTYARSWQERNPDRVKEAGRRHKLKRKYGLSLEQYNQLFLAQNGLCKGCLKHASQLPKNLAVDHDHSTGLVRGLLCTQCNFAVAHSQDSAATLRRLADYLEAINIKTY